MRLLNKPLYIAEIYFIFTLVLFLFGPSLWTKTNLLFLITILALYQFAFSWGYIYGIHNVNKCTYLEYLKNKSTSIYKVKTRRFIKISIICGLIMTIISIITYTKLSTISLSILLNETINAIKNPLLAYNESFKEAIPGGFVYKIIVLAAPITWSSFPLSMAYFKKMNPLYKILTIILFLLEAVRWIIMGRNKGVFDLAIIIIAIIVIKMMQNKFEIINSKSYKKRKSNHKIKIIFAIILTALCVAYFSNAIGSRTSSYYNYNVRIDAPLMKICPGFLQPTLIYLTSYLTQGYYSFSRIVELEWTPMFGIGNSMFLISNIGSLLNIDLYQYTYQTKLMAEGIDSMSAWHSFYTWVANDVHWIGVIVIMFLIGYFFANVVKTCIINRELITYPLLCLMFILILYLPANNQVFSHPTTFMTFWVLVVYWLIIKKRIIFKKKSVWEMPDD